MMLALVIGLNVAVFAVVNTMLFRGFHLVKDNRRLVYIQERYTIANGCCLLYADFLAWRDQVRSFREMAFLGAKPAVINDNAYDAATHLAAPLILLLVAAFGCLLPVRRAMRVDPAVALRHD
jgi:hypothetical protein